MKLRHLCFLCVSVLVSSCLLQPAAPPNGTQSGTTPIQGLIVMDDVMNGKSAEGGEIMANFAVTTGSSSNALSSKNLQSHVIRKLSALQDSTTCAVDTEVSGGNAPTATFIDAGVMTFNVDGQTGTSAFDEDGSSNYTREITSQIATDTYDVTAAGSSQIPAFTVKLSMPEVLGNVIFAASNEVNSVVVYSTAPLIITWNAPTIANANNLIIADVYSNTATTSVHLQCQIPEAQVPISTTATSTLQWTIPVTYTGQLPTTNTAQIDLIRANVADYSGSTTLSIETQGLRAQVQDATVD